MFTFQFPILWYGDKCSVGKGMHSTEWFVCMFVCYQLFSKTTRPNCMKFSGMLCHHPRTNRLDFGSDQAKGQGQGHEGLKNYLTELHEIFRDDLSSSKDRMIKFWKWSRQRSRSRSQKGQKHILVITHSVFVRFIWNQCQKVHFSTPYPLIGQRSRSRSNTYFGHNTLNFRPIHMKPT